MELRKPSPRPLILVDERGRAVAAPGDGARVGRPGPLGRERLLFALPLAWAELDRGVMLDVAGPLDADSAGAVTGKGRVYVPRMLHARWVADTRRLSG